MNTLPRYHRISADRKPARFLIARNLPVEFDEDAPLDDLWDIHDDAMQRFDRSEKLVKRDKPNEKSLLDLKTVIADRILEKCHFCDRRCGANRRKGKFGYCRIGAVSRYSSEFLHYGEEPELVPSHTVFLSGCVFSCVYCQNWGISTNPDLGMPIIPEDLSKIAAAKRGLGARNLNFVTPTPHLHTILHILAEMRINTPVIWNSNMYHSEEAAKLLCGVVDVYLGDFKYGNDGCAKKYSNAEHYWDTVTRNFLYAYNDSEILLRQLVLPGHVECCTAPIIEWVRKNIPEIRFNLMFQYRPEYLAYKYPEIDRALTHSEEARAQELLMKSGILG
ncbi:MAG TPA: radical SAM protein [Methanosarcinales archaeon]|nr:radical SAM protein [Methanosarcinales archaeon]